MSRLSKNEIEQEIEDSVADGSALRGQSSYKKDRVRPPYSSRDRDHASKRNSSGMRSWKEKTQEGAL